MNRIGRFVATIVLSAALFLIGVYTSVEAVAYHDRFYEKEYMKNDVVENTGISMPELMMITDEMQLFLQGERSDFDISATIDGVYQSVFTTEEQSHMMDVQTLFIRYRLLRNLSFPVLACFLLLLIPKQTRYHVSRIFRNSALVLLSCFVLLGISGMLFFDQMFELFHIVFFDNMNWTFDMDYSVLVNMVPETFFVDCALRIALYSSTFYIAIVLGSACIMRKFKKRDKIL